MKRASTPPALPRLINTKIPTPLQLTPGEHRLLNAYRKMDDATRCDMLDSCELAAVKRPRRVAPRFLLIAGGAA